MKTERKREANECTAKLKTNETNLFQSLGNVEANNSQRNVHARTHTTHRTSGSGIKPDMIKLFNSEGMNKRQGRGNLQNISGNMLCACKSVVFSPQLRSHVLFHIQHSSRRRREGRYVPRFTLLPGDRQLPLASQSEAVKNRPLLSHWSSAPRN